MIDDRDDQDEDVGGIEIAPIECDECGKVVYADPKRLITDDPIDCSEHT